jgi:hypothetical protein
LGAKKLLRQAGLPVQPFCRVKTQTLTQGDVKRLIALMHEAERLRHELGKGGIPFAPLPTNG